MRSTVLPGLACLVSLGLPALAVADDLTTYKGPCDASAAVALDADTFVVGNDETNTLYVYRRGQAASIGMLSLSKFLDAPEGHEADIEGAAAVGHRIYWIASHSRDGKGRSQPTRRRFFATDLVPGTSPALRPVGKPYTDLLRDIDAFEPLEPYKLKAAARLAAEADGGLNIEGLAATPSGGLLIGLRNPLPHGRALIVPLDNPAELIEGKRAKLGAPIELDLGGRGVRSIELVGSAYLVVAGPTADNGTFALFRWSGNAGDAPARIAGIELGTLRPEALFAIPGSDTVQLLSDDGGVMEAGVECKKLPPARQTFRSLIVKP